MRIVRKYLTAEEVSPSNVRWEETCDCVQQTADGGATWTDNPGIDPRHFGGYRLPPVGGEDPRCQAAANMVKCIHDSIDAVTNAVNEAQSVTAMLAVFVVFIPGIGALLALIWAVAEAFFTIGFTVIGAAFTTDVYDQLTCIFFANIGEDGQVSATQMGGILSDINSQIGGTVFAVMNYILQTWGEVGLSNAGAVGNASADCSACGAITLIIYSDGDGAHGQTLVNVGENVWELHSAVIANGHPHTWVASSGGEAFDVVAVSTSGDTPSFVFVAHPGETPGFAGGWGGSPSYPRDENVVVWGIGGGSAYPDDAGQTWTMTIEIQPHV